MKNKETFEQLRKETKQAFRNFMNNKTRENLEAYKSIKAKRDNCI